MFCFQNALQGRERLLSDSFSRIECRMKLLGATGIEDKLQDGVPDTIFNLRKAGIVVWVLTGMAYTTCSVMFRSLAM